jgi:hypothetical protein
MSENFFAEERPLHPFLFMGCWNQPGKGLEAVAAAIRARQEEMLVLGGDNIYPEKFTDAKTGEKHKVYSQSLLDAGIEMLGQKTIYASLGNHNVVSPEILDHEMEMPWILPYSYYCAKFGDGYALVILNTNLEGAALSKMIVWFKEIQTKLAADHVPYYLVQHEPYASYKKGKKQSLLIGGALLESISYSPIAVLCADTHNFQRGTLTLKNGAVLDQYVVGTGGAQPDSVGAANSDTFTTGSAQYTLKEHMPGYGFLAVNVGSAEFIQVADWPTGILIGGSIKGRKDKTRKSSRKHRATRKIVRRARKNI